MDENTRQETVALQNDLRNFRGTLQSLAAQLLDFQNEYQLRVEQAEKAKGDVGLNTPTNFQYFNEEGIRAFHERQEARTAERDDAITAIVAEYEEKANEIYTQTREVISAQKAKIAEVKENFLPLVESRIKYLKTKNLRLSDPNRRDLAEMEQFRKAINGFDNLTNNIERYFEGNKDLNNVINANNEIVNNFEALEKNCNSIIRMLDAQERAQKMGNNAQTNNNSNNNNNGTTDNNNNNNQNETDVPSTTTVDPVELPEQEVDVIIPDNTVAEERVLGEDSNFRYVLNEEATMQNYRNSGYGQNAFGHYFNPNIDEYDETYDPLQDPLFQVVDVYEKTRVLDEEATMQNYRNSGYGKNAFGHYFNPNIDEYDEIYDPLQDPLFQAFKEVENYKGRRNVTDIVNIGKVEKDDKTKEEPGKTGDGTPSDDEPSKEDPNPTGDNDKPKTEDEEETLINPTPPVPPAGGGEERQPGDEELEQERQKRGTSLLEILGKLQDGLVYLNDKDYKRYTASNISVSGQFKAKLSNQKSGWMYKVVGFTSAVIISGVSALRKLASKVTFKPTHKEEVEILKDRLSNLSEEEMEILYREYKGNQMIFHGVPASISGIIVECIKGWSYERIITPLKYKAQGLYSQIVSDFLELTDIAAQLQNPGLAPQERANLEARRDALLENKAAQIIEYRSTMVEINDELSSGVIGRGEDQRAMASKMNRVGLRFASNRTVDGELAVEQANIAAKERIAINNNDDLGALVAFMENEKLLADNTEIVASITGDKSVGARDYDPLMFELDYQNDPFMRDLFTTLAAVSSVVNVANTISEARAHALQEAQVNNQMAAARQDMADAQQRVNQYGEQIKGYGDAIAEGEKAQLIQGEIAFTNTWERMNLDITGWKIASDKYHALDAAAHKAYNEAYTQVSDTISRIAANHANGTLDTIGVLDRLGNLTATSQQRITDLYTQYLPELQNYAATHPQFDLTSIMSGMEYITKNSNAISNMANINKEIAVIGDELAKMQLSGAFTDINIVDSLWPALVSAGSTFGLIGTITEQMKKRVENGLYGAEILDQLDEISYEDIEAVEQSRGMHR